MLARISISVCFFTLMSLISAAQTALPGGDNIPAAEEHRFILKVKTVEEFLQRFNDDSGSFLRREFQKAKRPYNISRPLLVHTLFADRSKLQDSDRQSFISRVTDPAAPYYISFYDSSWYAQVNSAFSYEGKRLNLTLVLRVSVDASNIDRWKIAGVHGLPEVQSSSPPVDSPKPLPPGKSAASSVAISGADNATNFMGLFRVLVPGLNDQDVFLPEYLDSEKGRRFLDMIRSEKLRFIQTNEVKYHFFQIPDYVFVVERYDNATNYSGWLISSFEKLSASAKAIRRDQLLNL